MSISWKILLSAAIVLGGVVTGFVMASAATKNDKNVLRRSNPYAHAVTAPPASFSNPDSPAATGGGSLGYNQNIYRF